MKTVTPELIAEIAQMIVPEDLADEYRLLGYEMNLTHMGVVTIDDVRRLLRSMYEKRARMNELINKVEQGLDLLIPSTSAASAE
jgi:hypothetical protein